MQQLLVLKINIKVIVSPVSQPLSLPSFSLTMKGFTFKSRSTDSRKGGGGLNAHFLTIIILYSDPFKNTDTYLTIFGCFKGALIGRGSSNSRMDVDSFL